MKTEGVDASELMIACEQGDVATVERLLNQGHDVEDQDRFNSTALMYAVMSTNKENKSVIINLLINKGADISHFNFEHQTALILASESDDLGCFKQLLQHIITTGGDIASWEFDQISKNITAKDSFKDEMNQFNNKTQTSEQAPNLAQASNLAQAPNPAPARSVFTGVLAVILYPFRLLWRALGAAFKKVGAAVLQFFINRSGEKKTPKSIYTNPDDGNDNVPAMTKSTSKSEIPHPSIKEKKGKIRFSSINPVAGANKTPTCKPGNKSNTPDRF